MSVPDKTPAANGDNKREIEVGLIGRKGMSGLAIVMGTDRSPHKTFVQSAGRGWQIHSNDLREAIQGSRSLHQRLLLYGHAFLMQTGYTAMANGRSKIEDRLARWLLMAHDRVDGDDLQLTHEFLSIMLGVRRPGSPMHSTYSSGRALLTHVAASSQLLTVKA